MNFKRLQKSSNKHLDYIDFIKGLAAVSVILLHTLPIKVLYDSFAIFHIWQAVPIFLFITFYFGFRNLENKFNIFKGYYSIDRIKKTFMKLWLPLIILAVIEALFFVIIGNKKMALSCVFCYGNGPGSYYIWCYMQLWLLMPFIYFILKKTNILVGGGILLIIGTLCDFLFEKHFGYQPRFTCFRYIFLSVPAFIYLKGIKIKEILFFIILSVIYLFVIFYSDFPVWIDPILPDGWEEQTGLAFFYTLFLFMFLSKNYEKIKENKLAKYITHVGTISWEVFLMQMILLGTEVINIMSTKFFQSIYLQVGFKVIVVLSISLLSAELYKKSLSAINHYAKFGRN